MRTFTTTLSGVAHQVNVIETLTDMWDLRNVVEENLDIVWGLDVETTGLDVFDPSFKIRMVQVSDGEQAWLLKVEDQPWVWREAKSLLETPGLRFATHNKFDALAIFKEFGVVLGTRMVDTLILASLLYPAERDQRDLKHLTTELLDGPELKAAEERLHAAFKQLAIEDGEKAIARAPKKLAGWGFTNIPNHVHEYEEYGALDAIAVCHLAGALVQRIPEPTRNLIAYEMWLSQLSIGMQVRGCLVDQEWVEVGLGQAQFEIEVAEETIKHHTGLDSARSPKRVAWLLEHGVKFDAEAVTEKGSPSLAKENLPPMVAKYGHLPEVGDVLRAIATISEMSNKATNLSNFLVYSDAEGRVHPEVNTLRARTARMSVTQPALQTLHPSLRAALVADEGMSLVSIDFGQVEARVAAALSGDPVLSNLILEGKDMHNVTAEAVFGPDFTDEDRAVAKVCNFQSLFGGGPKALAKATGIPVKKAREVNSTWRQTYAEVSAFGDALGQRAWITTPTGRRLPVDAEAPYAALNYMIQSTARDLLVIAVYRLIHQLGIPEKAIWMLVHDEVVLQVPEHMAEEIAAEAQECMETTLYGIPIVAEFKIHGKRWGK